MWGGSGRGGASNLTGADRGRMWIGAVSPASSAITTVFLSKVNGGAVVTVPLIGQLCVVTSMLCCHSFGVDHFWFVVSARWRHHIEAVISNHSRAAFTIPSLHEAGLVLH